MKRQLTVLGCIVCALVLLTGTMAFAQALGPHMDAGAGNPCKICHDTAKGTPALRGWAGGGAGPATGWGSKPISALCYSCHLSGGGWLTNGGHNMLNNAYADAAHGYDITDVPEEPEGSAQGSTYTDITDTGLPYTTTGALECTSCHNVHVSTVRPFNQRAGYQQMCDECHQGRVNNASGTTMPGSQRAFSTHPTQQALADTAVANIRVTTDIDSNLRIATNAAPNYSLGGHLTGTGGSTGNMDCQTCHAVHGPGQDVAPVNDLLAIDNTTTTGQADPSALCEGCHYGGDGGEQVGSVVVGSDLGAGEYSDHPIDSLDNRAFYPTGVAIPANWLNAGTPNSDRGAQPLYGATDSSPVCSSCHDTHGGITGTQLLRGPSVTLGGSTTWSFDYDEWCFVCHTNAEVIPANHHSVINNLNTAQGDEIDSQLGCGDCHGFGSGVTDWTAHNGFWRFNASVASTDSAVCEACHSEDDPRTFVTPALKGQTFTTSATAFPATHGTLRGSGSGSSHQVNAAPDGSNTNMVTAMSAVTWVSGGTSEQGASNTPLCESCHNILVNGVSGSTGLRNGWQANLLLAPYEDDDTGVGAGDGSQEYGPMTDDHDFYGSTTYGAGHTSVDFCRGCHNRVGVDEFVHNPYAHTMDTTYTYDAGTEPYGRTTNTVLTAGTCPEQTTADAGLNGSTATVAPGGLSYPQADEVDCDSCHRPHSASTASYDSGLNRYLVLEITDSNWGTTICAECHDTDVSCNQ